MTKLNHNSTARTTVLFKDCRRPCNGCEAHSKYQTLRSPHPCPKIAITFHKFSLLLFSVALSIAYALFLSLSLVCALRHTTQCKPVLLFKNFRRPPATQNTCHQNVTFHNFFCLFFHVCFSCFVFGLFSVRLLLPFGLLVADIPIVVVVIVVGDVGLTV